GFKIRENYPIGCMVTLRGQRMYEFLDRLVAVALPRVRDFRGISGRAFDGRGNYNIGVKAQIIFPEIEYDKIDSLRVLNISSTTACARCAASAGTNAWIAWWRWGVITCATSEATQAVPSMVVATTSSV